MLNRFDPTPALTFGKEINTTSGFVAHAQITEINGTGVQKALNGNEGRREFVTLSESEKREDKLIGEEVGMEKMVDLQKKKELKILMSYQFQPSLSIAAEKMTDGQRASGMNLEIGVSVDVGHALSEKSKVVCVKKGPEFRSPLKGLGPNLLLQQRQLAKGQNGSWDLGVDKMQQLNSWTGKQSIWKNSTGRELVRKM